MTLRTPPSVIHVTTAGLPSCPPQSVFPAALDRYEIDVLMGYITN